MARIDSFLAQLMAYEAEALLVESGDNLYLVKGEQRVPLMQVRAGAIANAHVAALLGEIAPPEMRAAIELSATGASNGPLEWEYQWGTCFFQVEAAVVGGRIRARLQEVSGAIATTPTAAPVEDPSLNDERPQIEQYLRAALERGSSDLHLTAGRAPMCRIDGEMTSLHASTSSHGGTREPLDPYLLQKMIEEIVPDRSRVELEATHDVDFSYDLPALGARAGARVRCNVFRDSTGVGGVFRCFPLQPKSAHEIGLPEAALELCARRHGLIVVTGAAGSGKSTTIAAMIDWINANRADHVVTIEDPVEIVHAPKRSLVNQRQVGEHTGSFARALRAAQREDPDVVLVGEVRDLDTVTTALEMAETHLVIVTMHSTTATAALERLLDRFPVEQQRAARNTLAQSLAGVITQTLCKRTGGGRVAAYDVVIATPELAAQVRAGSHEVPHALDDQLRDLVARGLIHENEALARAVDARNLFARPRAVA